MKPTSQNDAEQTKELEIVSAYCTYAYQEPKGTMAKRNKEQEKYPCFHNDCHKKSSHGILTKFLLFILVVV